MFKAGQLVMTPKIMNRAVMDINFAVFLGKSVERFRSADWGEIDAEDKAQNDAAALADVGMILGSYKKDSECVWIIADHDRRATTILFPDEY